MVAAVCNISTGVQVSGAAGKAQTNPRNTPGQLWRACSNANPLPCIDYAAWKYGQSDAEMRLVAWRESRDEPGVSNGSCLGLFQILYPGTWAGVTVNGAYVRSPYAKRSPYVARWSALDAAWLWSEGDASAWSTYP